MWQANVIQKTRNNGSLTLTIGYTNGKDNFQESVTVGSAQDDNWLGTITGDRLKQLNDLDTFADKIQLGAIAVVAAAPPVV